MRGRPRCVPDLRVRCTQPASSLVTKPFGWPLTGIFPMHRALGIFTWPKPTATLTAAGVLKGTFHSLGWLKEDERNWAEPTTLEMWMSMATGMWRFSAAPLPLCALGPQSHQRLKGATHSHRVHSSSTQQRFSTSRGPLLWWDRSANAEWKLLSPHGRPSVTVAHMAHMAVSTRHPSVPQRRSLPPAIAGGSGVRLPGGGSMDYYLFTASQGKPRPRDL